MIHPCRVLIVDDSPMIRQSLQDILGADSRFQITGIAESGGQALRLLAESNFDLISLDIVMPGMSGLSALKYLMINYPTPTVMVSRLTQEGAQETMEALRYGAVDFVPKPSKIESGTDLRAISAEILIKFAWAAKVEIETLRYVRMRPSHNFSERRETPHHVVSLGAHEGGYSTLMKIIPRLRRDLSASYLFVLYEPARYVDVFVRYIRDYSEVEVYRAEDGRPLHAGSCYIAAGEDYVILRPELGGRLALHVHPAPFESQKGSINRLFYSVAEIMGDRALGVVLSGSGDDGAEGLEEILRIGGRALVQDPKTCLVKEMPLASLGRCRVEHKESDHRLAERLNSLLFAH